MRSAASALAELDTYGTAATADKYLEEIKQKVAESKAVGRGRHRRARHRAHQARAQGAPDPGAVDPHRVRGRDGPEEARRGARKRRRSPTPRRRRSAADRESAASARSRGCRRPTWRFLERYPVLKQGVANQYQAILLGGAVGVLGAHAIAAAAARCSAGAELMALPFLVERLKRRLEIEKKYAARAGRRDVAGGAARRRSRRSRAARFGRMRQLCDRIQENYRGLSPASQGVLAEQRAKFDAILASFLKRLWLLAASTTRWPALDRRRGRCARDRASSSRRSRHEQLAAAGARGAGEEPRDQARAARDGARRTTPAARRSAPSSTRSSRCSSCCCRSRSPPPTPPPSRPRSTTCWRRREADARRVEEMERMLGRSARALRRRARRAAAAARRRGARRRRTRRRTPAPRRRRDRAGSAARAMLRSDGGLPRVPAAAGRPSWCARCAPSRPTPSCCTA